MSYIGRSPQIGAYSKLDAITTDGSASYTMQLNSGNFVPESVNHLIVSVNGVIQAPTDSFTVSGSTITFASSLSVSDTIDFIMALGNVLDIGVPSDATISTAKIQDSAVTNAKLQNSSITLNGSAVSLGGSATVGGANTPSFFAWVDTDQSISGGSNTKVQFDGELYDSDNCYDNTSTYRFTPTEAGKYFLFAQVYFAISSTGSEGSIRIYKNGTSGLQYFARSTYVGGPATQTANIQGIVDANGTSDYFEIYIECSSSTLKDDTNQYRNWFGGYKIIGA